MKIKDLIKLCGGVGVVAKKLGINRHTVMSWVRQKNIPLRHWAALMRMNTTITPAVLGQVCFFEHSSGVDLE